MPKKKEFNLTLAKREVAKHDLALSSHEEAELNSIFPKDEDRVVGAMVYLFRKAKYPKSEICKILSVDKRTIDRIYGTVTYSDFLRHNMEEVLNEGTELNELAPTDPIEAQEMRNEKTTNKLNQILNGITPSKIFEADLKELTASYKELLSANRLDGGLSTSNVGIKGEIVHYDEDKARQASKNLKNIDKQIEGTKKLLRELSIEEGLKE